MNEEIEKGKWIPQTRKHEQFRGRSKIPIMAKKKGIFGFLEESILFKS